MVQAAAADAANNLIPLSVEAVGQMQFSTAMVQQPVPALHNFSGQAQIVYHGWQPPSRTELSGSPFESLDCTLTSWQQLALIAF